MDLHGEWPLPVPDAMRSLVADARAATVPAAEEPGPATVLPDAATSLVVCTFEHHRDVVVIGPRTRATYHRHEPTPLRITIRLQPGRAGLLLARSANDLVNRVVPLSQLWGKPAADVVDELAMATDDPAEFADRLHRVLLTRVATAPRRDLSHSELVRAATQVLSTSGGTAVRATARRLHISERQLRNLFAETVGLSPKHVARIDRVRTVLAGARHERLAQLAIRTGYYDQSHLTAEFRALMGVPPAAYLAGRRPPATACHTMRPELPA